MSNKIKFYDFTIQFLSLSDFISVKKIKLIQFLMSICNSKLTF